MERRRGEKLKSIFTYGMFIIAVIGVIISIVRTNNQADQARLQVAQARQAATTQQYKADKEMHGKLRVMENEIIDNSVTLKKLDTSDDNTNVQISRLKDSLVVFPTKDEVNAKFANYSTTLKTDMMTVNTQLNSLNQRISHLEGAWQLWIINFYRSPPVLTRSADPVPLPPTIYDNEMYK